MNFRACFDFPPCGLIAAMLLGLQGCMTMPYPPLPKDAIKPIIGVSRFKNEAGFSGQWELGRGIPDLLVAELLQTGRATVVDRQYLNDVVGELKLQDNKLFRKEASADRGRLKHARYLIRGVISDFTQTGNATGWFRSSKAEAGIFGSSALVMINLTIIDVETGEILCSVPAEGRAYASFKWARFNYKDVSFGGETFFRTPIGKATQAALRNAVKQIISQIPITKWQPRIAETSGTRAIINGGANYAIPSNAVFNVRSAARAVTDPTTGNTIAHIPGEITGQFRVENIYPLSAEGAILSGQVKRGDYLELVAPGDKPPQ